MRGVLYIVATPIGNLEDISARALATLRAVDCIAAEDTRHSRPLLQHFGIATRMVSCHGHNEAARIDQLLAMLRAGQSVALITDAGTPAIADPGARVVAAAREAGITVVPIPGPCAAIAALSAAGRASAGFTCLGFLPERAGRRRALLEQVRPLTHPLICYVARWDVARDLTALREVLGDRDATVARELTKRYEEFQTGSLTALIAWAERTQPKGEFVVVVAGAEESS